MPLYTATSSDKPDPGRAPRGDTDKGYRKKLSESQEKGYICGIIRVFSGAVREVSGCLFEGFFPIPFDGYPRWTLPKILRGPNWGPFLS